MATIDTSIYGQMLRPVKSIADYDAEYEQAQANKLQRLIQGQTMSMNKMKMDEAQRGLDEENQIRSIIQGLGAAPLPDVANALQKAGYLKRATDIRDKVASQEKSAADVDKTKAGTAKDYAEMVRKGLGFVFANPSPEAANSTISILEKQTGKDLSQYRQQIAGFSTPEQFQSWAAGHSAEIDKLLPKTQTTSLGGTMSYEAVSPITGKVTQTGKETITESEAQRLTRERQAADALAGRQVTMRGQNMVDARQRDALVAEAGGPTQAALVKKFGKAPADRRWKEDGSLEVIPGSASDTKSGAQADKNKQIQSTLTEQADSVLGTVKEAKKITGWDTAGVGGLLAKLPMTDARKLAGYVDTIKANLGFDRLQQMRDMSPTGGALGQVAVQEINYLQSTVAKLDQLQDPRDVIEALDKIEKHYTRWKNTLGSSSGGATGEWSGKGPQVGTVENGYKFKGGNPADKANWEKTK